MEVYSGILIQEHGSSDGKETAHETELLSWQPYGDSYTGGVKVTSGYVLQAPEIQNEAAIQTYHANITTLATDDVGQQETVNIFTYVGGGHDHTVMEPTAAMDMTAISDTLRLDKAFTPTQALVDVSGTFADIPQQLRGQGVLFSRTQGGDYELIHLQEGRADLAGNTPEYISPLQNQFMSI